MPTRDLGNLENEDVVDVRYIKLRSDQGDEFLKDLQNAHDKMRRKEKEQDKQEQKEQSWWKLW